MYFEFLLFTRRCFLSVSSASLAISKTDDVITENCFFFPAFFCGWLTAQAYDRPGTVLQQSGCSPPRPPLTVPAACVTRLLHRSLADDDY